jgi:hypothetical protein
VGQEKHLMFFFKKIETLFVTQKKLVLKLE